MTYLPKPGTVPEQLLAVLEGRGWVATAILANELSMLRRDLSSPIKRALQNGLIERRGELRGEIQIRLTGQKEPEPKREPQPMPRVSSVWELGTVL